MGRMNAKQAVTISLGCRLNAAESENMAALAEKSGGAPVIINTCAVTREAVRQSRQAIRRAAKTYPGREVIVTGCAAEIEPEAFEAMPEVSRRLPNPDKLNPSLWSGAMPAGPRHLDVRAPLEVQNGCDHRCTFCIIPYGRGDARSKPVAEACREAIELAGRGAREIVLTGVDLTSWGPDLGEGLKLGHLVEALDRELPGDVTIRLSSIDGAEIDDRLFRLMTEVERVAPYAHLSLQSGDDMILKRMKRRHSRADAVDLCQRLRAARPDMAFGADLIAGFPTETEEMFTNTVRLVGECGLAYVHVFPFSPRQGTPAARMPQLPREVVKERAGRLREVAGEAIQRHLQDQVGSIATVLIEEVKAEGPKGRLANFTEVSLPSSFPAEPGQKVAARLTERDGRRLRAVPLS
jgi:threonylcarbamoyladenosine tRNA methylthiotransferase MtaB